MKKWLVRVVLAVVGAVVLAILVFASEIIIAINDGPSEKAFINPDHTPMDFGVKGRKITYVILGDSTAAGRGAPYSDGIAVGTARHLAKKYRVRMINLSVSGATTSDVLSQQIPETMALHPDIVLMSVGANDATHFTPSTVLKPELISTITALRQGNKNCAVVVTGCPQMGSIPRFAQPLRWFAGTQTDRINNVFTDVLRSTDIVWAHIAQRTGYAFSQDPTLFSTDRFHPNSRGYAVWMPVLNDALDIASKQVQNVSSAHRKSTAN